jgi:hypothetical protein
VCLRLETCLRAAPAGFRDAQPPPALPPGQLTHRNFAASAHVRLCRTSARPPCRRVGKAWWQGVLVVVCDPHRGVVVEGRCHESHIIAEDDAMKPQMQVDMMKRECGVDTGCYGRTHFGRQFF